MMTLLVGSPEIHVQTSSSTTEEVKSAICECIHDLVKASKDLAQEPHRQSLKLAVVEAQESLEKIQGIVEKLPRKKWKIVRGNHFLDPVLLEPQPSTTLLRDGASKTKRRRFWTPESMLGDNEQSFQTYLDLIAKYKYKPSEARLKELIAHLEDHKEDRVPAKEETPEQLWCEMVFRGVRETRNRRLDGMTIGQTRIEQWDVIPVAVKNPCERCAQSSLDLACEYAGRPGVTRCRECILSKRTCSLSNSPSTASPTRQSERATTYRGSRKGASQYDFPDSDDVIVIDSDHSSPKRTASSVSSKRKQGSASTSGANKRPRATASVKSSCGSSGSRGGRQISEDDDEDDAIAEMRLALCGLQDQVQDLRTVQQSWKAVRMDAVDKVQSFRDEIMDILSRLPA